MAEIDQALLGGPGARIHVVGIGGAGMSAIARVLLGRGVAVSGSDRQASDITRALQAAGAKVFEGHAAANIAGAGALLISSAVRDDNPEVVAARAAGIPVLKRREALPLLLAGKTQIAVAGTHGKTTTTALIVHILRETGRDPSYIVGGIMNNTGDNARAGSGDAFVIEADEYDYMFLGLAPKIAVVTNVEHDHPDMFPTFQDVLAAFRRFLDQIPADGTLIACADDPGAFRLAYERREQGKPVILYGMDKSDADWSGIPGEIQDLQTTQFVVRTFHHHMPVRKHVVSALSGEHNMRNALAALAAAHAHGVPLAEAIPALATFKGAGRRFEVMGTAGGVTVISDYGHHPTAIQATLQAARQRYPGAHLWAVWQPHTYSRTRLLAGEFARAFALADHALITDIYASREKWAPGDPDGASLARLAAEAGHPDARHSGDIPATAALLIREVEPGDAVIIFSAGDAPKIGEFLLTSLAASGKS